jgi:hypothetical protein
VRLAYEGVNASELTSPITITDGQATIWPMQ